MKKNRIIYYPSEPLGSIKELVSEASKNAGNQVAYRFMENDKEISVTYKAFEKDTFALGTGLASIGSASCHIALVGDNSYDWLCVYLTVLKSSGVFVPIDKELLPADMANVINDSDSEVLFYAKRFEKFVKEYTDKLPKIKHFIAIDGYAETEDGKYLSYHLLKDRGLALYDHGDTTYTDMTCDPYALKMLVYTSGTTGIAKGVMLCEHNLVSVIYYGMMVSQTLHKSLSVLPYNHTYEAVAGILVSIRNHNEVYINDNIKNVLANIQYFKPEIIYLVPAFVEAFYKKIWANIRHSGREKAFKALLRFSASSRRVGIDMRKQLFAAVHEAFGGELKKIVCGGAPVRPELGEFFDAVGISLCNGYGITECSPIVSANQDHFNDCTTVGIKLPCVDVTIDDPDEDGIGEICVKGDIVMLGYYKKPELTNEVLDDNGVFRTGDYGYINHLGQLVITGRKKNLIILSNGKNIFPEEIENYIENIPYVGEVVVYGHKDEHGQDTALYAEIFLSEEKLEEMGIESVEEQLKTDVAHACMPLPAYKRISKIFVRKTPFDKTTTNKIKRNSFEKQ